MVRPHFDGEDILPHHNALHSNIYTIRLDNGYMITKGKVYKCYYVWHMWNSTCSQCYLIILCDVLMVIRLSILFGQNYG